MDWSHQKELPVCTTKIYLASGASCTWMKYYKLTKVASTTTYRCLIRTNHAQ
jgi:hypothetical protein